MVGGRRIPIHSAPPLLSRCAAAQAASLTAGVRQIQGTLNGLGERCGNANLCSLIPTLRLKAEFADAFDIGVTEEKLATDGRPL